MFFFNFLIVTMIMTPKCYETLPVSELKTYLKHDSKDVFDFDLQLENNNAFVYYLESGKVILMPNSRLDTSKGILFNDNNCFKECLQKDSFPIENEDVSLEEMYQPELLELDKRMDEIITYLSIAYNCKSNSLSLLLQKAREKEAHRKVSDKENLYSGLLLGEYIRISNNANWILLKKYGTFNPYYTPALIYPDNSILVLSDNLDLYFDSSSITPENFIGLPFIKEPKLKLESDFFKKNYPGYKIL